MKKATKKPAKSSAKRAHAGEKRKYALGGIRAVEKDSVVTTRNHFWAY